MRTNACGPWLRQADPFRNTQAELILEATGLKWNGFQVVSDGGLLPVAPYVETWWVEQQLGIANLTRFHGNSCPGNLCSLLPWAVLQHAHMHLPAHCPLIPSSHPASTRPYVIRMYVIC